jgi:hypothetical protein
MGDGRYRRWMAVVEDAVVAGDAIYIDTCTKRMTNYFPANQSGRSSIECSRVHGLFFSVKRSEKPQDDLFVLTAISVSIVPKCLLSFVLLLRSNNPSSLPGLQLAMLVHAARLQLRCQTVVAASRPLFTSAARRSVKIPSLGDITAKDSVLFKGRLAAFREERKRPVSPPPASPIVATGASTSQPGTEPPKAGIVKSILYGSEKGQREEAEMEQSYSKVLARGKYVHAIEFHHVKPDKHEEYVRLVGDAFPKIAEDPNNKCHLVGSWKTEIGMPDIFGEPQPGCAYTW